MKRTTMVTLTLMLLGAASWAQTTVSQDVTVLGAYGIADSGQSIDSGEAGAYAYQKNGYSTNLNVTFSSKVATFWDFGVKLNTKSRVGSGYVPLQLVTASAQSFGITVDSAWAKGNLGTALRWSDPWSLYLTSGKYQTSASNLQKVSLYGTESVLNMLKTANTINASLELDYQGDPTASTGTRPTLQLQGVTALFADEAVARLYDTDGSQSNHGKAVIGQYAPQIFANLKLTNVALGLFTLAAEGVYSSDGAGINSGNAWGASVLLTTPLVPGRLSLPVGVGVAYYEKNIDALAASIGTDITDKTVDFRDTYRAGAGAGLHYSESDSLAADLNFAGSASRVGHIYRDPITLFGASVDGKLMFASTYFVGAGVLAGTLTDVVWQTRADVASIFDDFRQTLTPSENWGWEAYTGVALGSSGSLVLGVNNNKGLAMNYGLESLKDGEYKFRQRGTASADKRYETFSVYLKTSFKL